MRLPLPLAATACAALAGCAHGPEQPAIELTVAGDERGCRFEEEGRVVARGTVAEVETMLGQAGKQWKGRSVTLLGGVDDAPYKCFGLAAYVLQRELGGGRIGFISEPRRTD